VPLRHRSLRRAFEGRVLPDRRPDAVRDRRGLLHELHGGATETPPRPAGTGLTHVRGAATTPTAVPVRRGRPRGARLATAARFQVSWPVRVARRALAAATLGYIPRRTLRRIRAADASVAARVDWPGRVRVRHDGHAGHAPGAQHDERARSVGRSDQALRASDRRGPGTGLAHASDG